MLDDWNVWFDEFVEKHFTSIFVVIILVLCVLMALILVRGARAADRCRDYETDVRIQHTRYFGNSFPYWYGLGQLKQESVCRADATAFDHGMGIAQFMPATAKEINDKLGEKLDPYHPDQAIRMQAYYMSRLHKQNWVGLLWITYQGYNGGFTNLKRERDRAGITDWQAMKNVCKRKIIPLKGGRQLSLCEVNYDYSRKVYKYGQIYKRGRDAMAFWQKESMASPTGNNSGSGSFVFY
jgi:hypothetical protein